MSINHSECRRLSQTFHQVTNVSQTSDGYVVIHLETALTVDLIICDSMHKKQNGSIIIDWIIKESGRFMLSTLRFFAFWNRNRSKELCLDQQ